MATKRFKLRLETESVHSITPSNSVHSSSEHSSLAHKRKDRLHPHLHKQPKSKKPYHANHIAKTRKKIDDWMAVEPEQYGKKPAAPPLPRKVNKYTAMRRQDFIASRISDFDIGANSKLGKVVHYWTASEDALLVEAVEKYGFDFDRIKAKNSFLGRRTASALEARFRAQQPQMWEEHKPKKPLFGDIRFWSTKEETALKRGVSNHGFDWERIHQSERKVLGRRTLTALQSRYNDSLRAGQS
ncbi:hypothetical protein TrLO_g8632 [Triparma laevis f. longispina]|uniref:Myb-like domain-containing protein n=1 Tax=Triparma laevis f. longispina TaxID=1714387 RepID=A0A9W7AVX6_9STRA|nr:hypothetical protein TrLO_g8632 [Triparma laevis f. longispina]